MDKFIQTYLNIISEATGESNKKVLDSLLKVYKKNGYSWKDCSRNNAAQLYRLFNATDSISQEDKDAMILYFCDRPYGTLNADAEKKFSSIYNKLNKGAGYTKGQAISKLTDEEIKEYFTDFAKVAYDSFKAGTLDKYKEMLKEIKKSDNK